jgi:O-antigen/teichoic acid export membrane protein
VSLNVVAVLVAFLVGTLILRLVLPSKVRAAKAEDELRSWVRSGVPLLAIGLLLVINSQVGTILLGLLDDPAAAGIFSAATKISAFTSFLFLAATYPLYPTVARLWATGEQAELQRLLTRAIRPVLLGSVAVAVVFLVFGRPILRIIGADFGDGVTALRVLTIGELVKVLAGFGGLALVMTPFESSMARAMALAVAINVPLTVVLIPVWGASGAAVATSASSVLSSAYIAWLSWRKLGLYAPALGLPRRRGRST